MIQQITDLVDSGQIPQIENIMELRWRGWKVVYNGFVKFKGASVAIDRKYVVNTKITVSIQP